MTSKIIISSNSAWNLFNFRSGLIKALRREGYDVIAAAREDGYSGRIRDLGCSFVDLPVDSNGTHPGGDLLLFGHYLRLMRTELPVAYLGYTIKPNIYGSLAAQMFGIPVINNISGLGSTFIYHGPVTRIVRCLYRFALSRSRKVYFHNRDDQQLFIANRLAKREATDRLPGSGIDLARYVPVAPAPATQRAFRFLLIGRMLREKGVEHFAEAARMVRQRFPQTCFELLGFVDAKNGNAISYEQIRRWQEEGVIHYHGSTDDVRPYIIDADCIVLPSYREGVPRSLIEAAAMSRPIIATDAVGCRDAVEHGITGLLCQIGNVADLAEKMIQMLKLPAQQRLEMGNAGRRKIEAEFDEKIIIQKYLNVIHELGGLRVRGNAEQRI